MTSSNHSGGNSASGQNNNNRSSSNRRRRRKPQSKGGNQQATPKSRVLRERVASDKPLEGAFTELIPELQKALTANGYHVPTPIQEQTIPHLLEERDMIGCAQTGTGKTAAFTLPILQIMSGDAYPPDPGCPRTLILAPTRELAAQIGDSVEAYGKHLEITYTVIFGGVNEKPQISALKRGVDIVVATPGRLIDLMNQGHLDLGDVDTFVLDEADRMLDMGFINDIKKVIKQLPRERWSLFFSATMPKEVEKLANSMLHEPVRISIAPDKPAVERIEQSLLYVDKNDKDELMASLFENNENMKRVIVFTQMKHMANRVCEKLDKKGITSAAIHGNKTQAARIKALDRFKSGEVSVLVATDIAARGIDVDGITHVINYDLPNEPETYVHRIGRTARAGSEGEAISFCSGRERDYLRAIEKLLGKPIPADLDHALHSETARQATGADAKPEPKQQGRGGGQRRGGGGGNRGGGGGGRPGGGGGRKSSERRRSQGRRSSSGR